MVAGHLGQMGGRALSAHRGNWGSRALAERGLEFYQVIGRRGGETTQRKVGAEHHTRIGRSGGRQKPKRKNPTLLDEGGRV